MDWKQVINFLERLQEQRWLRLTVNIVLGLGLGIFFGWYLLRDWRQLLEIGVILDFYQLSVALALYGLNFMLLIAAWRSIVIRFGGLSGWKQNAFLYANTHVMKFLPTPAWFLASRVYFYGRTGMHRRTALTTTALETLLHMLAGIVFYTIVSIDPRHPLTWLYLLAFVPVVVVLLKPKWLELEWLSGGKAEPGIRQRDVAIWLSIYLLTWIVAGPFFSSIMQSFVKVEPLELGELWRIWTASSLVAYVSAYALGGIGIFREFTLTWLLNRFYSPPVALLLALSVRLVMTAAGILWGLGISVTTNVLARLDANAVRSTHVEEETG